MARNPRRQLQVATEPTGSWVQTERAAHERWARMALECPRAAGVMHVIVANIGRHNALVVSQQNLARMCGCSVRTLQRAIKTLRERNWIEVRQVGSQGTAAAYIVNDRVAWTGKRDGIRYSMFSAQIIASDDEQPDRDQLGQQPALEQIPSLEPGEEQLPSGPGEPPPSQPSIGGLEPDLPSRGAADEDGQQLDIEDSPPTDDEIPY